MTSPALEREFNRLWPEKKAARDPIRRAWEQFQQSGGDYPAFEAAVESVVNAELEELAPDRGVYA